jgi:hypothetical protein
LKTRQNKTGGQDTQKQNKDKDDQKEEASNENWLNIRNKTQEVVESREE